MYRYGDLMLPHLLFFWGPSPGCLCLKTPPPPPLMPFLITFPGQRKPYRVHFHTGMRQSQSWQSLMDVIESYSIILMHTQFLNRLLHNPHNASPFLAQISMRFYASQLPSLVCPCDSVRRIAISKYKCAWNDESICLIRKTDTHSRKKKKDCWH